MQAVRRGACFAGGRAWPDLRLWVQELPDGTVSIERQRSGKALLAFDAYSQRAPGTREVRLGNARFYAFAGPRLGAQHLVVWRRTIDVHNMVQRWRASGCGLEPCILDPFSLLRLTRADRQFTAAVWRWDEPGVRDPQRYWKDSVGSWMYWESFWLPAEDATHASEAPAFQDLAGTMLVQTLGTESAGGLETSRQVPNSFDATFAVPATSTAAQKDRAYAIVYRFNVWGSDESRSGTGSDLWSPEARLAVTAIEAAIDRFDVGSILDCACGDANWIVPYFVSRRPEVAYCGIDIVPEVIKQNQVAFPGLQFWTIDVAEAPLPTGADMIFSKETVNHMDLEDAKKAIQRFKDTGARLLLTNVHAGADNFLGADKACFTTYIKYDYERQPFNMTRIARIIEYQGKDTFYDLFALQS